MPEIFLVAHMIHWQSNNLTMHINESHACMHAGVNLDFFEENIN